MNFLRANLRIKRQDFRVFKETLSIVVILQFSISSFIRKLFVQIKLCSKFASAFKALAHGVTGNTSGFGPEESRFEP